jgi:zinc protease
MRSRFALLMLAVAASMLTAMPVWAVTVERVVSPGGIEAWLVEDHLNPIIDIEVNFAGGASQDSPNRYGLSAMTAALLDEGAGSLKSQAFQGRLEDLAIELSFDSGKDSFRGHLKTLSTNQQQAFELFSLSLTHPRFDGEAQDRIKAQMLEELAHEQQDPNSIAGNEWFRRMFPNHPYGRPGHGDAASLKAITRADLQAYVTRHLTLDTMIVGVAGDIRPEQLGPVLDRLFGGIKPRQQAIAVAATAPIKTGGRVVIKQNIPQSVAIFGVQGVQRSDPDWYAALVMNYILGGGGFSSWLTEEVREKRGLAYSVYTQLEPLQHTGLLVGSVATRNEMLGQSLDLIKQQWLRMRDEGPSDSEIEDAKNFLVGSFPLQLDSTGQVASLMVQLQRDHLGEDYLSRRSGLIRAVSKEDITRVAKRLLDPDAIFTVVVGMPKDIDAAPQH